VPALGSIAAVEARIASVTARFGVPAANFAATFASVQQAPIPSAPAAPAAPAVPLATPAVATPSTTGASGASSADDGRAAPAPDWARNLPAAGLPWVDEIHAAAERAGVDPRLLAALVRAESGFRPDARSHAGAIGLAQLMPATARGLGVDPHDPGQNLAGGARFLREMLDRFGTPELALAAYNAGPARVAQAGGIPQIRETHAYVPRVMSYYAELKGTV
jgi:soluble lytic murein transglycosylase-like protein